MSDLRRILMAEDDPRDVELILSVLADNNLANEVVVVPDGAAALDYLYLRGKFADRAPGNPAVVLLDIKMPKVVGLEVLKTIRSDDRLKMMAVVILTSSREQRDLFKSYAMGVNGYVVKPVDFEEFVAAIKQIGLYWAVINEPPPDRSGTTTT